MLQWAMANPGSTLILLILLLFVVANSIEVVAKAIGGGYRRVCPRCGGTIEAEVVHVL